MNLPTLDTVVLNTINTYEHAENLPQIDLSQFHAPLVVGSGNGIATGKILFRNVPAFFASESEVAEKLRNIPSIEEVVVVSASGEKHAPIILELAKEMGKKTFLISSSENSSARAIADTSFVFPKNTEPYTYNTSTYFGYLYGAEANRELSKLRDHITQTIDTILSNVDWKSYTGYIVVLPNEFALLRDMIEMKFIELFGRKLARDVFTYEQMKHAITVVPDDRELFLCFGNEN